MSNNTEVYWEANGVSLHTYAWSIETKQGRFAGPPKRGEDFSLPFKHGRTRIKKARGSRVLRLPMWIAPCDESGSPYPGIPEEAGLDKNWDYLMSKLDTEGQFPLVKRWYVDGAVKVVTAMAELMDPPDITVRARNTWGFSLELHLADPYFYSGLTPDQPVGAITVDGNAPTDRVILKLGAGDRVTTPEGNWIQYDGTGTVEINCAEGSAISGGKYVNGLVSRNPKFPEWPMLRPGEQALVGTGTIAYDAAWR